eukprot:g14008.t1
MKIESHNFTVLPKGFVKMTNLKKLRISNGPLKKLPVGMESLSKLKDISITFNSIRSFDVDILKYKQLSRLVLSYNKITFVHRNLWRHPAMGLLLINSNIGLNVPSDMHLPNLYFLDISNNSITLPKTLGKEHLRSIVFLFLNGNRLTGKYLPNSFDTLSPTLKKLGIGRCGLLGVPQYLKSFDKLTYLDIRNNNITSIPDQFINWIENRNIEAYMDGNAFICSKHSGESVSKVCKTLCSKYCYTANYKNNYCDHECNSKDCDYDENECK